jgi:GWxTD domain-containing protein
VGRATLRRWVRARALAAAFVAAAGLGCAGGGDAPGGLVGDDLPPAALPITRLGISAYMEGNLREAERLLKGAVSHSYRDTVARYYLAHAYLARDTPEGRMAAEEVLTSLTSIAEEHPDYLLTLARLRLRQGYRSNARNVFERVLAIEPDDAGILTELGSMAEKDWWRFQEKDDRARTLDLYQRAIRVDPSAARPRKRLAVIALEEGRVSVARAHVDTLILEDPDDAEARLLTGVVHEAAGDFMAANRAFRQVLDGMAGFDRVAYTDPIYLEPDTLRVWSAVVDAVVGHDATELPFWEQHDPSPGTPLNERFVVHAARTAMADFLYGDEDSGLRGWETAPGEFYIRYGRPLRRRYELVSGGSFPQPTWLQVFDVGGRLVELRFIDYSLNGRFRLPIEFDSAPAHAILRRSRPENGQLGDRVGRVPLAHAVAWFRGAHGEPRLEVALLGDPRWTRAEVTARDSSWAEVFALSEPVTARRWSAAGRTSGSGIFELSLYPGPAATRLELSLGNEGRVDAGLDPPPSGEGFAVSDLWLGFTTDRGFMGNPGLAYPATLPVAVRFEVYDHYRDPSGRGYLEAQVSVVPLESDRSPLMEAIRGRSRASFVAAILSEEPEGLIWERELEVDVSRLAAGPYELRLEVRDTITGKTVETRRRFEVRSDR